MQLTTGGSPDAHAGKDSGSVSPRAATTTQLTRRPKATSATAQVLTRTPLKTRSFPVGAEITEVRLPPRKDFRDPPHDIELQDGTHSAPSESSSGGKVDES